MMETKDAQLQGNAELISNFLLLQWHKTSVAIQSMWWATSYLFYLPAGIDTTAASIFAKLANNFSERGVTWLKCKTVPIDGASVMVGIRNGVVALIKQVAPEVVSSTASASGGPDWKHFCDAPLSAVRRTFWAELQVIMLEILDVTEQWPKGRHNAEEVCRRAP